MAMGTFIFAQSKYFEFFFLKKKFIEKKSFGKKKNSPPRLQVKKSKKYGSNQVKKLLDVLLP